MSDVKLPSISNRSSSRKNESPMLPKKIEPNKKPKPPLRKGESGVLRND